MICLAQTASTTNAERLKAHRIAAGLSRKELARTAGVCLRAIVQLENGHRARRETLQKLTQTLGFAFQE